MRKGCEDGNRWSGSYFTWGGHGTPHVKRLGCLAGLAGLAGWPGWLPGDRAGWPGWLAGQGWLGSRPGLAGWPGRAGWLDGQKVYPRWHPRWHPHFHHGYWFGGRLHYYLCGSA